MTTSTTPNADYAFWTVPGSSNKITYSLAAFHEIDFVVNEGYRRIPHGGIESGGLLFGYTSDDGVRIESFRAIECEHASGPSFNLSEKDMAGLGQQISTAASDPELNGMEVVGWFIAHTRGPLKLTEKEKLLFERFFPGPNQLTALVKPERFHPTRFGFLVRDQAGQLNTDATTIAIILPGRGTNGKDGPVPSIAAPPETVQTRTPVHPPAETTNKRIVQPIPSAQPILPGPPTPSLPPIPEPASFDQLVAQPVPADHSRLEMDTLPAEPHIADVPETVRPAPPERIALPTAAATRNLPEVEFQRRHPKYATRAGDRKQYGIQFVLVLLIAAVLGCCVGFWAYLQLPSALIPMTAQRHENRLVISWAPAQTRNSAYAAIRVDDGEPVALSTAEKTAGSTAVSNTSDNVKIELIAQHWLRDSRGIVRFVSGVANNAPPVSPVSNNKPAASNSAPSQLP